MNAFALEVKGISKFFPDVEVLDNVSLRVCPGTVHALMGENGAGRSTLMKCLTGIYRSGKGSTRVKEEPVGFADTMDTLRSEIPMIHQELNLVPHVTMAKNIWLGREPMRCGFVDHGQLTRQTQALLGKLNVHLTADRLVGDLSIIAQQMVEIVKAVLWNADIVIMDEPTSALTKGEVAYLFTIIRDLRVQGRAIIYISHRTDEIFAIIDEISVFRDSTWVGSKDTTEFTRQSLTTQMMGRKSTQLLPKFNNTIDEEALAVRSLTRHGVFHNASFTVHRGKIPDMAGLVDAGRSEVIRSLFGMERFDNGEVLVDGVPVTIDPPSVAVEKGMALLTEGCKRSGLFLVLSMLGNMSTIRIPEYIDKSGSVQHVKMAKDCMEQVRRLNIKTPTMDRIINNLSEGNQQKVLTTHWLLARLKILILDEPTRGVDVGTKAGIYHLISELANRGMAIIMVSPELPEILGVSDRVMVTHEGRITDILEEDGADRETILSLASH